MLSFTTQPSDHRRKRTETSHAQTIAPRLRSTVQIGVGVRGCRCGVRSHLGSRKDSATARVERASKLLAGRFPRAIGYGALVTQAEIIAYGAARIRSRSKRHFCGLLQHYRSLPQKNNPLEGLHAYSASSVISAANPRESNFTLRSCGTSFISLTKVSSSPVTQISRS
jgi:hypothetical protein